MNNQLDIESAIQEQAEYIADLQGATLTRFGIQLNEDECLEWLEVDATVDQAMEWIDHGCGPGDFAGCADKEGAWA